MYNSVNIPNNPNLDTILERIQAIIDDLSPEQLELAFRSAEQEYGNFLTRGKLGNRIQAILNDLTDDNLLERFQTFLHSEGKINPRSFKIRVLNKLGIVDDNNDFTSVLSVLEFVLALQSQENPLETLLNNPEKSTNEIIITWYDFIKLGADPTALDSQGRTFLHRLLMSGRSWQDIEGALRRLSELPDEIWLELVNAVNGRGETALQSLLNSKLSFELKSKFSNMLIESGADYTPEQLEQLEQRQIPSGVHQQGNPHTVFAVKRENITAQDDTGLINSNDRYDSFFEL